jgi:hypothetical protein
LRRRVRRCGRRRTDNQKLIEKSVGDRRATGGRVWPRSQSVVADVTGQVIFEFRNVPIPGGPSVSQADPFRLKSPFWFIRLSG